MRTDKDLVGILILETNSEGLITYCTTQNNLSLEAGKFSKGCIMLDTTTGKVYKNSGSVERPEWENMNPIKKSIVKLTSEDIIGMKTEPIPLVAGVNGKTIVVNDICLKMKTTETQYTGGGDLEFKYLDGANITADMSGDIVKAKNTESITINKALTSSLIGSKGQPIIMTNKTASFADGDGTAVVIVSYHLV